MLGVQAFEYKQGWRWPCFVTNLSTEKTADILWRHDWFPPEMTTEQRPQKFHTDDVSLPSSDWSGRESNLLLPVAQTRSWQWRVISIREFLQSLLRRHFAGKPVVASWNVGCYLRGSLSNHDGDRIDDFKKTIGFIIKTTALHVRHAF